MARDGDLAVVDASGLAYDPIQQAWSIGGEVGVDYMIAARKLA